MSKKYIIIILLYIGIMYDYESLQQSIKISLIINNRISMTNALYKSKKDGLDVTHPLNFGETES